MTQQTFTIDELLDQLRVGLHRYRSRRRRRARVPKNAGTETAPWQLLVRSAG